MTPLSLPAIFSLFPDTDNSVVVLWNITRDNFCDWLDGGAVDPPPVEELIPAMGHAAGPDGVFMGRYQATRHLELWTLDDPDNLMGACEDTDGQSGSLAVGSATVSGHDNDLDVSLTRTNTFGQTGTGTVYDGNGAAWHYSWSLNSGSTRTTSFMS